MLIYTQAESIRIACKPLPQNNNIAKRTCLHPNRTHFCQSVGESFLKKEVLLVFRVHRTRSQVSGPFPGNKSIPDIGHIIKQQLGFFRISLYLVL